MLILANLFLGFLRILFGFVKQDTPAYLFDCLMQPAFDVNDDELFPGAAVFRVKL